MERFIQQVQAAGSIDELRRVVSDAVSSNLTTAQLKVLGGLIADRTFALTLSKSLAA